MGQIRLEAVIGEDDHVGRLAVSGDETAQGTIDEGEVAVHHRTELGAVLRRRSHLAVVLGESILPERVADLVEAGQVDRQYGQVRADVNQPLGRFQGPAVDFHGNAQHVDRIHDRVCRRGSIDAREELGEQSSIGRLVVGKRCQ